MKTSELGPIDRRMAIGGVIAGAAGLALPHRQGRTVIQRGMFGGGLARFEQGEANFSILASRMTFAEEDPEVVVGRVLWVDDQAGHTLRSSMITDYDVSEVQPEQGRSRQVLGIMSVNGEGEYPFELVVIDANLPGSGEDRAILKVGDGARTGENATPASGLGFSYMAAGTIVTGDIQEIGVQIDIATGVIQPAPA